MEGGCAGHRPELRSVARGVSGDRPPPCGGINTEGIRCRRTARSSDGLVGRSRHHLATNPTEECPVRTRLVNVSLFGLSALVVSALVAGRGRPPVEGRWVLDVEESTRRLTARASADESRRPALEAKLQAELDAAAADRPGDRDGLGQANLADAEMASIGVESDLHGERLRAAGNQKLNRMLQVRTGPTATQLVMLVRPHEVTPTVEAHRGDVYQFRSGDRFSERSEGREVGGGWERREKEGKVAVILAPDAGPPKVFFEEGRDRLVEAVGGGLVYKRAE